MLREERMLDLRSSENSRIAFRFKLIASDRFFTRFFISCESLPTHVSHEYASALFIDSIDQHFLLSFFAICRLGFSSLVVRSQCMCHMNMPVASAWTALISIVCFLSLQFQICRLVLWCQNSPNFRVNFWYNRLFNCLVFCCCLFFSFFFLLQILTFFQGFCSHPFCFLSSFSVRLLAVINGWFHLIVRFKFLFSIIQHRQMCHFYLLRSLILPFDLRYRLDHSPKLDCCHNSAMSFCSDLCCDRVTSAGSLSESDFLCRFCVWMDS